jgi:hypothetical protein
MMTAGRYAYHRYCVNLGGRSATTGAILPEWTDIGEAVRNGWEYASAVVHPLRDSGFDLGEAAYAVWRRAIMDSRKDLVIPEWSQLNGGTKIAWRGMATDILMDNRKTASGKYEAGHK